jgi:nucleoside-diphosphate-sugar epimerase
MDVLVTGGAGFIGSTVSAQLLKAGHKVTVVDNLTWGTAGLSANLGKPGFSFVKGDVRDKVLISRLMVGKDVVVHLAAVVGGGLCESSKATATDINVNGTTIVNSVLSDNQLLIYASSGSVYGEAKGSVCTEQTTPHPQSHYAATKLQAEQVFSKRPNAVVLRFATAYGASPRMRLDLLVNQFVYEALKRKELVVFGKESLRSTVHVKDIAESISFAIQNKKRMQGQVFNVTSEPALTKEQIARRIQEKTGCQLQFAESYADGRDYQLCADKITSLGYHAATSLDEGIAEVISAVENSKIDKTYFNNPPLNT